MLIYMLIYLNNLNANNIGHKFSYFLRRELNITYIEINRMVPFINQNIFNNIVISDYARRFVK